MFCNGYMNLTIYAARTTDSADRRLICNPTASLHRLDSQ